MFATCPLRTEYNGFFVLLYITYIHNWPLLMLLYLGGGIYGLKSTPNCKFLRNFSWQFYFFSEFFSEICRQDVAEEIFSFCCLTRGVNRGFKSAGTKSSEYGGRGMIPVLFLAKNSRITIDV